jgi:GH24 family phage-related lysozyme (muramidase)
MPLLASALDNLTEKRNRLASVERVTVVGARPPAQRGFFRSGLLAVGAVVVLVGVAHHMRAPAPAVPGPTVAAVAPSSAPPTTLAQAMGGLALPSVVLPRPSFAPPQGQITVPAYRPAIAALGPVMAPVSGSVSGSGANPSATDVQALAEQLLHGPDETSRFMALAVTVEGVRTQPYWDSAGLNIGMGYCITRRLAEEGPERVRADLTQVGLAPTTVAVLMGKDRRAQRAVSLSQEQAIALLRLVAPDYRARARAFIGAEAFDGLDEHKRNALTELTYNTGPNIEQFHHLRDAVRANRPVEAISHITPTYRDSDGTLVRNTRAGAYLAAAFWSARGLETSVRESHRFEALVGAGRSPVEVADPASLAPRKLSAALGHTAPAQAPLSPRATAAPVLRPR